MEGLTGVTVSHPSGALSPHYELTFLDPPSAVINVLEYAALNELPLEFPGFTTVRLRILTIDLRNETEDIDTTVYGSIKPTYLRRVIHRHWTVRARPA